MELQQNLPQLNRQKLGLAAISYDSEAVLKHFAGRKNITYPLLSDPDSRTIRAYGVLNEGVPVNTPKALENRFLRGGEWYGVPVPGTFMLDPRGIVVAKYFEEDYRERYTASEILVRQLGADSGLPRTVSETKHLTISTFASLTNVKMGQRIALVADVDLKPRMHVYAPGVEGYIAIDFSISESPAIKIHPATFPASKKLRLKAINETVPVYQGKFRIARDVNIGTDPQVKPELNEKGELVIHGTLRYQACDDRVCYVPQNVPLSWTLNYEALDMQRVPKELQR